MSVREARASSPKELRRVAGASFIGTMVEYYDFFLFGTASALVFSKLFFPSMSPTAGTLASFATLAVAFVARPLGGIIFGRIGDRVGRRTALMMSLILMGLGTVGIGLLPTYAVIGGWAPALLVTARLMQGFAVGGEWGGAVLLAVEHAPARRRAFYSSWTQAGVPAGLLLATGAFFLVQQMPQDAMLSWGWRIPFLASAVLVLVGIYIRFNVSESPEFEAIKESGEQTTNPTGAALKRAWPQILVASGATAVSGVFFYTASVFALSYASSETNLGRDEILGAVCIAAAVQVLVIPLVALLVDRYNPTVIIAIGCTLTMLTAFPFFWLLLSGSFAAVVVAMLIAITLCHSLTFTPLASFIPGLFETRIRYSGTSFGYQVGGVFLTGPVPFVAGALVAATQSSAPVALMIVASGGLSLVAVLVGLRLKGPDVIDDDSLPTSGKEQNSRTPSV